MFTGIIEAIGILTKRQQVNGDLTLSFESKDFDLADVALGDSIATNGVCLTVTAIGNQSFSADVSLETLSASTLGQLKVGQAVNLEKALLASSRLGGHIVSGHVDGIGHIEKLEKSARSWLLDVIVPNELKSFIAKKGSITVDGVSLTTNYLTANGFQLNIVPHTWQRTIIANYRIDQKVNIEVDILARYLDQLQQSPQVQQGVTANLLKQRGYL